MNENNLNKENFWDNCHSLYPQATEVFCKWIDEYKERVNWSQFIPVAKFHDLPIEMQAGIWFQFVIERGGCSYEIDIFEYDLEEDILTYMCALQAEFN